MYSLRTQLRKLRNWLVLLCTGRAEYTSLDEESYRQRILVMTSCFWLITVLTMTVLTPLIVDLSPQGERAADILFIITAVGVVVSMMILRIAQNRMAAANIMLLIYTGAFAGSCFVFGGTQSPTYPLMLLAPAMAGIIGSVAMSIVWGLIVLAFWAGVLIAEQNGMQFVQITQAENRNIAKFMAYCALSVAIVSVILIYAEMNKALRISLQKSNEELEHLSSHDQLTRLPNRRSYDERLASALHRAAQHDSTVALMMLDLNEFKGINDTYGHGVGDKVLITAAQRIQANLRETDLTARLGGDEFAIVLEDISSTDEVTRIANKLAHAIEQPLIVRQRQLSCSASIGIAMFPSDGRQREELEVAADKAMYHAKKRGIPVAQSSLESRKMPTPVSHINRA